MNIILAMELAFILYYFSQKQTPRLYKLTIRFIIHRNLASLQMKWNFVVWTLLVSKHDYVHLFKKKMNDSPNNF